MRTSTFRGWATRGRRGEGKWVRFDSAACVFRRAKSASGCARRSRGDAPRRALGGGVATVYDGRSAGPAAAAIGKPSVPLCGGVGSVGFNCDLSDFGRARLQLPARERFPICAGFVRGGGPHAAGQAKRRRGFSVRGSPNAEAPSGGDVPGLVWGCGAEVAEE